MNMKQDGSDGALCVADGGGSSEPKYGLQESCLCYTYFIFLHDLLDVEKKYRNKTTPHLCDYSTLR